MPKQRILHLSTLVEKGACTQQVNLFRELFGESVTVTERRAVSVAGNFHWTWAAMKLLSQTALDEYLRTKQTALVEYEKVRLTALDKYTRTRQPAWDEYEKIRQTAWDEYKKTQAKTFVNLYINDGGKSGHYEF